MPLKISDSGINKDVPNPKIVDGGIIKDLQKGLISDGGINKQVYKLEGAKPSTGLMSCPINNISSIRVTMKGFSGSTGSFTALFRIYDTQAINRFECEFMFDGTSSVATSVSFANINNYIRYEGTKIYTQYSRGTVYTIDFKNTFYHCKCNNQDSLALTAYTFRNMGYYDFYNGSSNAQIGFSDFFVNDIRIV